MAQILVGPSIEIQAPNVRFGDEQLKKLGAMAGVTAVQGMDLKDGTYGAIRIFFEDNDTMDKYLAWVKN